MYTNCSINPKLRSPNPIVLKFFMVAPGLFKNRIAPSAAVTKTVASTNGVSPAAILTLMATDNRVSLSAIVTIMATDMVVWLMSLSTMAHIMGTTIKKTIKPIANLSGVSDLPPETKRFSPFRPNTIEQNTKATIANPTTARVPHLLIASFMNAMIQGCPV